MKPSVGTWLERMDSALESLQRRCPACGGTIYRRFSLLDKIGLYLPLPHTIYAVHECESCHRRFRSLRSLTDLFLEAAWISALLVLGSWRPLALACPLTWLIVTYWLKQPASYDTIAAGVLTGVLWVLALVFGNARFGEFFVHHGLVAFAVTAFMVLAPVSIVLVLDRYTNFRLVPAGETFSPNP